MKNIKKLSSKLLRQDPRFLRNDFESQGVWGMPIIKKCEIDASTLNLIASDHVCSKANSIEKAKTVHFFVDDIKLERYYNQPFRYSRRLAQYASLLTPDFSLYTDLPLAIQIYNTFKSRYCGAYWQYCDLQVIPTISWSTPISYDFCFDGIERESVVAISTLGVHNEKNLFLGGYFEMIKRINPKQVLCFGALFPEMGDETISFPYYLTSRRLI